MFEPNEDQKEIFKEYDNTNNSLIINACPGAGKTSTLVELLKRTSNIKSSIFVCFNKSIADELATKVPSGTNVLTLHSLGFKALLSKRRRKYVVKENKTFTLGLKYLDLKRFKQEKDKYLYLYTLQKVIDLYRLNYCKSKEDLEIVLQKYSIDISEKEIDESIYLFSKIEKYNESDIDEQWIDFTDMLYFPVKFISSFEFKKYDIVMWDEIQDASILQYELIKRIKKKRGRLIGVGDKKQSIYLFCGASRSVFETIEMQPKTVSLPLSYSYRCGKEIVGEANKIFNEMKSPEWQIEGKVGKSEYKDIKQGDFILCRNNLPLVNLYVNLISEGKKCYIMGDDYGRDLLRILNKVKSEELGDELVNIQVEKLVSLKKKGVKNPLKNNSFLSLNEKAMILKVLEKKYHSSSEMKSMINLMYSNNSNNKNDIVLSSIHKSKGLESERVHLLYRNLIPSKYAKTNEELFSEMCLKYVAITRAISEFNYLDELPFKEEQFPNMLFEVRERYEEQIKEFEI